MYSYFLLLNVALGNILIFLIFCNTAESRDKYDHLSNLHCMQFLPAEMSQTFLTLHTMHKILFQTLFKTDLCMYLTTQIVNL